MAKLVCHGDKFRRENVPHLERHNERKNKNYSNSEINPALFHCNYRIIPSPENYSETIGKRIEQRNNPTGKALRKDAVVLSEFIISSSKTFFDELSELQKREFFQSAFDFLSDFFGKDNVVYAVVHNDEHTPHLHFGFVPLTEDMRLCAKEVVSKTSLKILQDKLPKHLKSAGFEIERGVENSTAKHLEPDEYKAEMERQKVSLSKEIESEKQQLEKISKKKADIKAVEDIEVKPTLIGNKVTVSADDYENLQTLAQKQIVSVKSTKKLKYEVEELKQKNQSLTATVEDLKKKSEVSIKLRIENEKLKKEVSFFKSSLAKVLDFIEKFNLKERLDLFLNPPKEREREQPKKKSYEIE